MRIALFLTCVNDAMFPATGQAVVRILERLGHTVEFPAAQTCCGQMHANSGYRDEAVPMVRHFADTFAPYQAIVAPSGSCVAMVRDAYPRLWPAAAPVAARTYELSELLVDVLEVTDLGAWFPHRVTYHPTCHSLRMLGVGDRPLRLLRAVENIELADLPEAEGCCGFGGTFALKNSDTSAAMLADKVRNVAGTRAEFLTAGDYSCLMHIGGGLSRSARTGSMPDDGGRGRAHSVRTIHLAEILAGTRERPWLPEEDAR
jgi:L-lactate dehydrogenase complex protein LldE